MTPYEYFDLAQGSLSNVTALVSLWVAILSGYVVVAYLVGARLTRAQVVMLNLNYTIWSLFLLACGGNLIANGMTWENAAKTPEAPVLFVPQAIYFHYCIGILLLITSLWFMWSVRHTKTD